MTTGIMKGQSLALLLNVLRDSHGSLDSVAATFHRSFPKGDLFKIGATITILLQDGMSRVVVEVLVFCFCCCTLVAHHRVILMGWKKDTYSALCSCI